MNKQAPETAKIAGDPVFGPTFEVLRERAPHETHGAVTFPLAPFLADRGVRVTLDEFEEYQVLRTRTDISSLAVERDALETELRRLWRITDAKTVEVLHVLKAWLYEAIARVSDGGHAKYRADFIWDRVRRGNSFAEELYTRDDLSSTLMLDGLDPEFSGLQYQAICALLDDREPFLELAEIVNKKRGAAEFRLWELLTGRDLPGHTPIDEEEVYTPYDDESAFKEPPLDVHGKPIWRSDAKWPLYGPFIMNRYHEIYPRVGNQAKAALRIRPLLEEQFKIKAHTFGLDQLRDIIKRHYRGEFR